MKKARSYRTLIIPSLLLLSLIIIFIFILNPTRLPEGSRRFLTTLLIIISLVIIVYIISSAKKIHQGNEGIVERFGQYRRTLKPGLNFIIPFVDRVVEESTREQLLDVESKLVVTRDQIPLDVNVVAYWKILDVARAYYNIEDLEDGLLKLIRSEIRHKISRMEFAEIFTSKDEISEALLHDVDEDTERWGIKVTGIEVQDILLAKAILGNAPDTIEFTFHNGIDWLALKYSFNLVIENDGVELTIQSIEDRGNGELVVRVKVPSGSNKAQLYKDVTQNYEITLKALEGTYQAELKARESEITFYREQSANLWTVISSLANRSINVQTTATAMNDNTDQSQNFNVGDFSINATNSVVNLRDISGTVTNTINQLPASPNPAQPGIKELLLELQAAIETDADLKDDAKGDALEQVNVLAELGQNPQQPEKEKLGRRAITFLKGIAATLPDTAKIVEACSKLLPLVAKVLGLPI